MKSICHWSIPIYTVSEANKSWHWSKKKKLHDLQKRWIWIWWNNEKPQIPLPCIIELSRGGKKLLDDDNLPISMKFIRDCIADLIFPGLARGQADSDKRIQWKYNQYTSKQYEIKISLYSIPSQLDQSQVPHPTND